MQSIAFPFSGSKKQYVLGHPCSFRRKRRGCCGESWRHLNFTPPPLHRGSHIRHIAPRWAPPLVPYFHSSTKKPRVILKNKYSLPVVNISSLFSRSSHHLLFTLLFYSASSFDTQYPPSPLQHLIYHTQWLPSLLSCPPLLLVPTSSPSACKWLWYRTLLT